MSFFTDDALILWTIYDHPRDFPDHVVVRPFAVRPGSLEPEPHQVGCLYRTLTAARTDCRRNGCSGFLQRDPGDDVNIIETWL
jgi:hypothetical protein